MFADFDAQALHLQPLTRSGVEADRIEPHELGRRQRAGEFRPGRLRFLGGAEHLAVEPHGAPERLLGGNPKTENHLSLGSERLRFFVADD